ncbi:TIGR02206 family membrane protein [Bacillaceae bacterium S4-13-58]
MISWWSEEAEYIQVFGLHHFIYIGLMVTALVILLIKREQVRENADKIANVILVVSILQQVLLYSWYVFETGFNVSESLPLHICRIASLLGIYFLITKNKIALDLLFYMGLFAYGSFLYPQRVYPVYHVIGISFVINHMVTILLPYFGYIAYGWRPKWKGLLRTYAIFLAYFLFVYFLNPIIDGNYFYLKYRPFFKEWPDYLYIPAVLFVTFIGFVIAFIVARSIGKASNKVELPSNLSR